MKDRVCIWLLAAASAVCLLRLTKTGQDAAKLLPAQVLVIACEDSRVTVESDNGASGAGETLDAALADLSEAAEGTLFLDTAEHIVLTQSAAALLPQAAWQRLFRPAAKLYLARVQALNAGGCTEFLRAHPGQTTLADVRAALLAGVPAQPALLIPDGNGGIRLAG